MKYAFAAIFACAMVFDSRPAPASGAPKREPPILVEQAIRLAARHLKERRIDLSRHYIDSIALRQNPQSPRGPSWVIIWELSEYAKGGQIIAHVSMDKTVEVRYGE